MSGRPLMPRNFPSSGFQVVDSATKIEEETLPFYNPKIFYPVHIGDVFDGRYQVVAKFGYGSTSTTWLCHDLTDKRFVTLKVHVNNLNPKRESEIYEHLKGIESDHPGRYVVRMLMDSFALQGPYGVHEVYVLPPLGLSLKLFQNTTPSRTLSPVLVLLTLRRLLAALDFLHCTANVTHTDVHAGNLLIGVADESKLAHFEEAEIERPSPRKLIEGATIHESQFMLGNIGPLYLCDLGEARIGSQHEGIAMPVQYRAPEIILDMPWHHSIDMWSVGLMAWHLLEPDNLFDIYDVKDKTRNEAHHLANIVALLGPPPLEFLKRSPKSCIYWDESGNWKHIVPIPARHSLESLKPTTLEDEDVEGFLDLLRGLLQWLPEKRLSAMEAFTHPWILGNLDNI